jgi:FkbM family methyltransferase
LKKPSDKSFAAELSGLKNRFRAHVRSVFKRIFHCLLGWLRIRRLREHSFFATLLARPAAVADFGAHRGEFFAALKSEHPISRALLIEADPALAESLNQTFGDEADVVHAAAVAENKQGPVTFTRSIELESSSVFKEWSAAHGIADQIKVPTVNFWNAFKQLGGRIDLIKMDVEGAEIGILESASASDLASCGQLTVEFHDKRPPFTRHNVDRVCRRMHAEGYAIVMANWPKVDDVLFVNLKRMPPVKRLCFRVRVALANALFITRRTIFGSGYSS